MAEARVEVLSPIRAPWRLTGERAHCQPGPGPKAAPALATRALCVKAGRRLLLRQVDLRVAAGSICAVVGPSGVGKTTLLKCFNRLIDLTPGLSLTGEVSIGERSVLAREVDVDQLRSRVGMLFQQPVVFPRSIEENVLFGLRRVRREVPKGQWGQRVERALRQVSLWDEVAHRLAAPAAELSVGQQQRLCLARALALEPEVLLMDEPTSALDPVSTAAIEQLVLSLAGRTTVLWVTHDPAQAQRIAGCILRMESRDGAGCVGDCVSLKEGSRCELATPERRTKRKEEVE